MKQIQTMVYESPAGPLVLGVCDEALWLCDWALPQRRLVWSRVMRACGVDLGQIDREFSRAFENSRKFSMSPAGVREDLERTFSMSERREGGGVEGVAVQLDEYFRGERRVFDMEVRMVGTPFQMEVWQALCEIAYGETMSYAELAAAIGHPKAVRAVAAAARANALSIVVPCHRLIGAAGALTGYAGGLDTKRALLDLERR